MTDETHNDGGQAYPAAWGNPQQGGDYVPGMTLRDWFAGQALAGMETWCPNFNHIDNEGRDIVSVNPEEYDRLRRLHRARWAYAQADAMIKARAAE